MQLKLGTTSFLVWVVYLFIQISLRITMRLQLEPYCMNNEISSLVVYLFIQFHLSITVQFKLGTTSFLVWVLYLSIQFHLHITVQFKLGTTSFLVWVVYLSIQFSLRITVRLQLDPYCMNNRISSWGVYLLDITVQLKLGTTSFLVWVLYLHIVQSR